MIQKNGPSTSQQYSRVLRDKVSEIRGRLEKSTAHSMLRIVDGPCDSADMADKSHEEWIYLQQNSAEVQALREVEDALDRVRQGTFGICVGCERSISQKRLLAVPWARYCISCQETLGRDKLMRAA